jgi:DNA anti-recombination protein RmuC
MISIAALLIAGIVSCSKDNEPGGMKQQQTELRSQLDSTIADVDREMNRVKTDLLAADEKTRQELNAEMDRLQAARDDLHQGVDKIAETTADNWNEFVMSVDRSLEKARQTLKDVRDQVAQKQQHTPAG